MVDDVMHNARVIEERKIENQFEGILDQLKSMSNLEIKPLSFYKKLSLSLKKSALSLQEINGYLMYFLHNTLHKHKYLWSI